MADDQKDNDSEGASAPKSKLKLIIAAVAALAILGGGAGYFFFFMHKGEEKHPEVTVVKPPVYVDVPEVLVNLANLPGERIQYLKVKIALEVKDQPAVAQIQPEMPRVQDIFQTYIRELRVGDLNGSVGMFRLKEELTRRVNAALQPVQVNAVLFKELIVQ
jgi:flagellar protein FliL